VGFLGLRLAETDREYVLTGVQVLTKVTWVR